MKLNLDLLNSLIDLPVKGESEIRNLFDDLGLEVEGFEEVDGQKIVQIETLAQRGDHLSALGVAREIKGRFGTDIKTPESVSLQKDLPLNRRVNIKTDLCFDYALAGADVDPDLKLSKEVKERLLEVKEDKHPLVNICNYASAELGQPVHVFDASKVKGNVSIVLSDSPEEVAALDGKTYQVPESSLLITDEEKIIAVAGVIGCANSSADNDTTEVLIESANFDPVTIRKTARKMGISTDASYAFERGVDPRGLLPALERIFALANLKETGFYFSDNQPELPKIDLQIDQFRRQFNDQELTEEQVNKFLQQLGYTQTASWQVEVPSWRYWNVQNPETVMEDYGRAKGFNTVEAKVIEFDPNISSDNYHEEFVDLTAMTLLGAGYNEVITRAYYSADDVAVLSKLDSKQESKHLKIINSLEGAYSNLKTTNLMHLARLAVTNKKFGIESIKVFELGRLFSSEKLASSDYDYEADYLTLALSGRVNDNSYQKAPDAENLIRSVRGLLDNLFSSLNLNLQIVKGMNPLLHPGRQATLLVKDQEVGVFGDIHPEIANYCGLKSSLIYAEIDIAKVMGLRSAKSQKELSDQPISKFELTFKLAKDYYAGELQKIIEQAGLENLISVEIFDSFSKPEENFNRISYRLNFQHPKKTLTSEEVDGAVWKFVEDLKTTHGIEIVE